jgi:hypothetical protein
LEELRASNFSYLQEKYTVISGSADAGKYPVDKEYHMMLGLTKREKVIEGISVERAQEIKLLMQERVMQMWN